MPLLTAKHYNEGSKNIHHKIDEMNPYNLKNYTIRDDDEITSSDDTEEEDENGESNAKSWFGSGRPRTAATASQSDDGILEKSKRPKSVSPFKKKSFSSFFRRSEENEEESEQKHDSTEVLTDRDNEENALSFAGSQEDYGDTTNSTRFWRSWRTRHQKHGQDASESHPISNTDVREHEENSFDYKEHSNSKRENTMEKLVSLEINAEKKSADIRDTDGEILREDSSASSIDRAVEIKKRLGGEFCRKQCHGGELDNDTVHKKNHNDQNSPLDDVRIPSPLTPVDDMLSWKKTNLSFGAEQYKHVYQIPKEYDSDTADFDNMNMIEDSKTYVNILNIIHLLDGTRDEFPNSKSLLEFSASILSLAQRVSGKINNLNSDDMNLEGNTKGLSKLTEKNNLLCEIKEKDLRIVKLESELNTSREKYETGLEDLYNCRKEVKAAREELGDVRHEVDHYEQLITNMKSQFQTEQENWQSLEESLKGDANSKADEAKKNILKYDEVKEDLASLNVKYKNLEFDHQVMKEQHESSRDRLCELIHSLTEHESIERQLREKVTQLEDNSRKMEATTTEVKRANLRIQQDYQRERHKVYDLRKDGKLLRNQLDMVCCHKSEALQFMAQLMMSYRNILSEDTLRECDGYLESLNANKLFNDMMFDPKVQLNEQQLKEHAAEERSRVTAFYRQFAKIQLLDQVVAKHISYMRSNSFLSQQLKGLRKQLQDNEEYIARLLKDCKTQRTLISKQDEKILQLKKSNINYRTKNKDLSNRITAQ